MTSTYVRKTNLFPWHISRLLVFRGRLARHRTLCGVWIGIYRMSGEHRDAEHVSDTCRRCVAIRELKEKRQQSRRVVALMENEQ